MIVGLVLSGGRSLRFGSDKALARLGERTLLELALGRLRAACSATAVSAQPGGPIAAFAERLGAPVLEDPPGSPRGPLSGVLAGLEWAQSQRATHLLTLPCDAPLLPEDLERRLIDAARGAPAALARAPGGLHPLCAVWDVGMARALRSALADGLHPPVHQILLDAGAAQARFDDDSAFININTTADLAEAERLSAAR
jgi:molybdopterin-guanine dinucleotide biosynthesis protein A